MESSKFQCISPRWTTQITSKCDILINCLNSYEFEKFDFIISVQNLNSTKCIIDYICCTNIHNRLCMTYNQSCKSWEYIYMNMFKQLTMSLKWSVIWLVLTLYLSKILLFNYLHLNRYTLEYIFII